MEIFLILLEEEVLLSSPGVDGSKAEFSTTLFGRQLLVDRGKIKVLMRILHRYIDIWEGKKTIIRVSSLDLSCLKIKENCLVSNNSYIFFRLVVTPSSLSR